MAKPKPKSAFLKGWQQIAEFLGLPISAHRRASRNGGRKAAEKGSKFDPCEQPGGGLRKA